jgi:hypothetical protein
MFQHEVMKVPVLIIGYSRTTEIKQMVEKLISFGAQNIYIALDYSDEPKIRNKQNNLVTSLNAIKSPTIRVWYRKKNHGVGLGVITALDWFFYHNDKGIILEDDLYFEKNFLEFCEEAFSSYKREDFFMISGNRFDDALGVESLSTTNYPQIWGWATWRENWVEMRELIVKVKTLHLRDLLKPNLCFFYSGARRVHKGIVDTWDSPLAYEMLLGSKVCLLPPVNLVSNVGADVHAAHTINNDFPLNHPIKILPNLVWQNLESLRGTTKKSNIFLEKRVFGIRIFHVLSPYKMFLEEKLNYEKRKNVISLKQRLIEVENFPKE